MNLKVKVIYVGIPHFLAQCHDCDWTFQDYRNRKKGQREIRKHVSKTGHTVALEKAVVTHYTA